MARKRGNELLGRLLDGLRIVAQFSVAIVFAIVIGGLIMLVTGSDPLLAYKALLQGAFGSSRAFGETLLSTTPLIFGGLAVAFGFRCGLFNIGVEGQIVMGGVVAAWIGYVIVGLPKLLHLPLGLAVGALTGAVWGAIPGYLKARLGVHEVINTIMLNYIAYNIAGYLVSTRGPMKDPGPLPASPVVEDTAKLPRILPGTRLSAGIFIALACVVILWVILFRTRLGYRVRAVGFSPEAAEFGGIDISRNLVIAMAISGGLGGLAGAVEVLGLHYRLYEQFSPGYGYDAIAVALLGLLHPVGVVPAALLFGILRSGSTTMMSVANISKDMVLVISALVIFFVAMNKTFERMLNVSLGGRDDGSRE